MQNIDLNGEWRLYISDDDRTASRESDLSGIVPLTALIPESLEVTLERLGVLPPLYQGTNILKAQKYERCHLWYARRFECAEVGDAYLRFEGIDTLADVYLNGVCIGSTDNAFIPHTLPADSLCEGENELLVHIKPAAVEAEKYPPVSTDGLPFYNGGAVRIRKPAYMHGWDIMPRVMSGAIWKGVSLVAAEEKKIKGLYFYTKRIEWQNAVVCIDYETEPTGELHIEGVCGRSRFETVVPAGKGTAEAAVSCPMLWAPKGMGKPNLYTVTVSLIQDGVTVETRSFEAGIRTAELKRTSVTDEKGGGEFCFYINGKRMFCLGTNHVPVDALLSKQAERLPKVLELLDDVGCNTVRVWGGGVYETDEFYTFCDRNGIAVWQDFMMACAKYPQDEEFAANLRREAEYTVGRLRNHPCLMLWAGDNEVDSVCCEWYDNKSDPNENILTREVLPSVLKRLDPHRDYLPSSPYFDKECYEKGTALSPENHLWGPRDWYKSDYYRCAPAHFASEIGYHGCPSPSSVGSFISEDKLCGWDNNDEWTVHAANMSTDADNQYGARIKLMAAQARFFFGGDPQSLDEFSLTSQISQAEALKYFIERFMSEKWRRTGIIWWNLIDGWPQFSDAVVDYYFGKKLAYDYIKRLQQPLCLLVDEEFNLRFINNTEHHSYAEYKVTDISAGRVVAEGSVCIGYNANTIIGKLDPPKHNSDILLLEWSYRSSGYAGERKGVNHRLCGEPPYDRERYLSQLRGAGLL